MTKRYNESLSKEQMMACSTNLGGEEGIKLLQHRQVIGACIMVQNKLKKKTVNSSTSALQASVSTIVVATVRDTKVPQTTAINLVVLVAIYGHGHGGRNDNHNKWQWFQQHHKDYKNGDIAMAVITAVVIDKSIKP